MWIEWQDTLLLQDTPLIRSSHLELATVVQLVPHERLAPVALEEISMEVLFENHQIPYLGTHTEVAPVFTREAEAPCAKNQNRRHSDTSLATPLDEWRISLGL
jgi:hypothetical protein